MYLPEHTETGCPFWYDGDPKRLRQCQKALGHGGGHQWNGPDGFYVKWSEKLIEAATSSTDAETADRSDG